PSSATACTPPCLVLRLHVIGTRRQRHAHAVVRLLRGRHPHPGTIEELFARVFGDGDTGGLDAFLGKTPVLAGLGHDTPLDTGRSATHLSATGARFRNLPVIAKPRSHAPRPPTE